MDAKYRLTRGEDNSFEIIITFPREVVKREYHQVLKSFVSQTEIKGFRKGQSPENLVEKKIGKETIYQNLIQKLIRDAYSEAIKEYHLNPIISPEIILSSTKEGEEWIIKLISCELPIVNLDNLMDEIKKQNAKGRIWTPKGIQTKETEDEQKKKEERVHEIVSEILKRVKLNLPKILIDHEINRRLSDLVDQLQKVNLKVDQYLLSKNLTLEQLKSQYRQEIENSWKIDLTLEKVADEYKVIVSKEEVDKLKNEKIDIYLASRLLRREKTVDYLLNL